MIRYYLLIICVLQATTLSASQRLKPHHRPQHSLVVMEPLDATMSMISNDALPANDLKIADATLSPQELCVQVQVNVLHPTIKSSTLHYVTLKALTSSQETLLVEVPISKLKDIQVAPKPDAQFPYQLALIHARLKGLRLLEWDGKSYGPERCQASLALITKEFPQLSGYCENLHKQLFDK